MIRRLKKDILQQLPHKTRKVVRVGILDPKKKAECTQICVGLSNISGNSVAKGHLRKKRKSSSAGAAATTDDDADAQKVGVSSLKKENFSALLQLFSKSGLAKVDAVLENIGKHLDDPQSGKLLVFAHHAPVMDAIEAYITRRGVELVRIDGQTQSVDRFANTRHFQSAPSCRVALLAITAAGIGITLTAANTVFFVEMFWTPGSLIQAEDRAHRLGQTSAVNVTYFLAKGTIDDILWPLLCRKVKTLGEIVEGEGGQAFEVHAETDETHAASSKRKAGVSSEDHTLSGTNIKLEDPEDESIDLTNIDTFVNDIAVKSLEDSDGAAEQKGRNETTECDENLILDSDEEDKDARPRIKASKGGKVLRRSRGGAGGKAKAAAVKGASEQTDDEPISLEDMRVVTETVDAVQLETDEMKKDKVAQLYARLYADGGVTRRDGRSRNTSTTKAGAPTVDLTSLCDTERVHSQLQQYPNLKIDNYSDFQEKAVAFLEANLEVHSK